MKTDFVQAAIEFAEMLRQQTRFTLGSLEIRDSDIREVDLLYQQSVQQCEEVKSKMVEVRDSLEALRLETDQKLEKDMEELQIKRECPVALTLKASEKENLCKTDHGEKHEEHQVKLKRGRPLDTRNRKNSVKNTSPARLQDATAKELLAVRTRGKMSLSELNGIIDGINRAIREKYELLKRARNTLNKTDSKRVHLWESQMEENADLKERFFISESELLTSLQPKLKAQFRIARHCLVALNRLEVVQSSEKDFFVVP